jgi:hypothetical protein
MSLLAFPAPETDEQFYLDELDKANRKLDAAIQFIELLEGLTTDKDTANRIRKYLQQEGIWPLPQKK